MKLRPLPNTVAITSPDQLKHGMRVTCEMLDNEGEWQTVEDAMISVDKDRSVWICQNVTDFGGGAQDYLGYRSARFVVTEFGAWTSYYETDVRNLCAAKAKPKPDTWTPDAPIYRRGSDWIREDKMSIAGKEYTFDEVCEQEVKFRAFRRAHSRYFPKAR